MDPGKTSWTKPLTQRVKGVVCGDFVSADTDGFAIDLNLAQLLAEFPIGRDTFFDLENACHH